MIFFWVCISFFGGGGGLYIPDNLEGKQKMLGQSIRMKNKLQ